MTKAKKESAKKPKRAPADQPPPEAARLLLRGPLDFHVFERGAAGKVYSPGQGWSSCKVVAANETGVLVLSGGSLLVVGDARNLLTPEKHHAYQLHRGRFQRLCAKRREQQEQQIAMRLALVATAEPIPAGEVEL